jgi:uroporphyrinogen-III synthase
MTATPPRVLVARARHQQSALSDRLRSHGIEPVEVPLLAIESPPDGGAELAEVVVGLAAGDVDALAITSPNGARALAAAMATADVSPSALAEVFVGCVGPGTAAATREVMGADPDLVASVHTTVGLGTEFPSGPGTVVLPRADISSPDLPELLAAKGWRVRDVAAYRTRLVTEVDERVRAALADGHIAAVAVGSPSTVEALVGVLDGMDMAAALVSIGPVTSARARAHGLDVAVEADPHDLSGLVAAVRRAVDR